MSLVGELTATLLKVKKTWIVINISGINDQEWRWNEKVFKTIKSICWQICNCGNMNYLSNNQHYTSTTLCVLSLYLDEPIGLFEKVWGKENQPMQCRLFISTLLRFAVLTKIKQHNILYKQKHRLYTALDVDALTLSPITLSHPHNN